MEILNIEQKPLKVKQRYTKDRLHKVLRAYKTFSTCDQVLLNATDETYLLQKACRILIKLGGYRLAWVDLAGNKGAKRIHPVTQAEFGKKYLDTVRIPKAEIENCTELAEKAIQTGKPCIRKNIETKYILRYSQSTEPGYTSLIVLPLIYHGQVFGTLNIYKEESEAFDGEEVKLLQELVKDLSYGIMAIQTRVKHKQTIEELKQSGDEFKKAMEETIHAMALAVEKRDPITAVHQQRVSKLAQAISKEINLPEEKVKDVQMSGIIHDIGMIYIPLEILTKPKMLSKDEFSLIKAHPQIGYDILKRIKFPWNVAPIVLQHHESMDGSGYPQGLSGKKILLEARILHVADVVEAMVSFRPYRQALDINSTLHEITKNKNILYDPEVVEACLYLFKKKTFKFD